MWVALLVCLFSLAPSESSAQELRIIRGGCTPHLSDADTTAAAGRHQMPRRLSTPNTQWDAEKVYRQAVILVSFSDKDFSMENPTAFYDSLFNYPGFNKRKGPGCVAEYLRQQSGGLFNTQFDVYGPIKVSTKAQPYSNPTSNTRNYGKDVFIEATNKVIDSLEVDFSPYDWNGNNNINQVIYVYAGYSGNQSSTKSYGHIWPNTSTFTTITTPNGLKITNYTASAEMWANDSSCGIGTILHEFTHSLGLPDIYPTTDDAGYSIVDEWDLMDGGNFTNYGWCPPNYTALEKMLLGWITPVDLTEPTTVTGMKTVDEGGEVYRIKHTENEWLLLENRQQTFWDAGLPGKGLVIYHVNYNRGYWSSNSVNNSVKNRRFELVHADNMDYDDWYSYIMTWTKPVQYANSGHMNSNLLSSSAYPWTTDSTSFVNDSLTNYSVPAAVMSNAGPDGTKMLSKPITNIVQNVDGTISFRFMGGNTKTIKGDVNGDERVDVADIASIISFMAGASENLLLEQADINEDGLVDVADISAVLTIMASTIFPF
ncbi:MAG: M6 family metalloprotease domain-containing protein [Prevotella sp.]|nr:M6 family metalloprotease domain-containing protein [Prevotella sp.]